MILPSLLAFAALVIAAMYSRRVVLRQVLWLSASYLFYSMSGARFLAILISSSLINYALGEYIRRRPTKGRLWIGIGFNILLLSFFRYLPLLTRTGTLSAAWPPGLLQQVAVPAGISFWTFQAIGYLFDLYREEEVDPSILEFCLYMAFWPTVLLGPICRLPKMLSQFRQVRVASSTDLSVGIRRIGLGLFMKGILAQVLVTGFVPGEGVAAGFGRSLVTWGGLDVWFLTIGFGFQLFFDFAGYSHIVIGGARLFGFQLEENFHSPYLSLTPSDFWNRWHMSLSSWIRDNVFMPIAGIKRSNSWRYLTLLFSMTLFGVWHGATATFVLWGLYNGVLLVVHRIWQQIQRNSRIDKVRPLSVGASWLLTFLAISAGWTLFRARDLEQAAAMFNGVLTPSTYLQLTLPRSYYWSVLVIALGYFAVEFGTGIWIERFDSIDSYMTAFSRHSYFGKLLYRLWVNRLWWLVPMASTLLVFGLALAMTSGSRMSSFVYAVF